MMIMSALCLLDVWMATISVSMFSLLYWFYHISVVAWLHYFAVIILYDSKKTWLCLPFLSCAVLIYSNQLLHRCADMCNHLLCIHLTAILFLQCPVCNSSFFFVHSK